jgi:hypothetical protein
MLRCICRKLYGCRRQSVAGDINEAYPAGWLSSEVVVNPACTMTTTSMLLATGCVGVDAQSLLVASTSLIVVACGLFWFLHNASVYD